MVLKTQQAFSWERAGTAIRSALTAALGIVLFASLTGCALYRNDKCYVEDRDYRLAKELFIESGSLDAVRKQMELMEWSTCEKNEVVYRLSKEFEVPDSPAAPAP